MTTSSHTNSHLFHEIPNLQVLDAADQFLDGFLCLMSRKLGSGVLLPALHCASIAVELCLKSLSALTIEVPDELFPGAFYVYARSGAKSHRLEELFDSAPEDAQQILETVFRSRPRLQKFRSLRDVLGSYNPMFVGSRYPFEPGANFDAVEFGALNEILHVLKTGVRAVPHRDVPDTTTAP